MIEANRSIQSSSSQPVAGPSGPRPQSVTFPPAAPAAPAVESQLSLTGATRAQTHLQLLDVSDEAVTAFARQTIARPLGELVRMKEFLTTYANRPLDKIPADEKGLLEAIPVDLRSRMQELLAALEVEIVVDQITNLSLSLPDEAYAIADKLKALEIAAGRGASPPELTELAGNLRNSLDGATRSSFDALKLQSLAMQPLLAEISRRLEPLREVQRGYQEEIEIKTRQGLAEVQGLPEAPSAGDQSRINEIRSHHIRQATSEVEAARMIGNLDLDQKDVRQNQHRSRDGLVKMMGHVDSLGQGLSQMLGQIEEYARCHRRDGKPDFSGFRPDLDLEKGHNAVLLRLFQLASDQNGEAGLNPEMEKLGELLARYNADSATPLSDPDKDLLKAFGIGVNADNKLINLANHQVFDLGAVEDLIDVHEQISLGIHQGVQETLVAATGMAVDWFRQMISDTGLASQLQERIEAGNRELGDLTLKLQRNNIALRAKRVEEQKARQELDTIKAENQAVLAMLAPFMADGRLSPAALAGDLEALNSVLGPLGLRLEKHGGRLRGWHLGRQLNPTEFHALFSAKLAELEQRQSSAATKLSRISGEADALVSENLTLERSVHSKEDAQRKLLQEYEQAIRQLSSLPLNRLEQLRKDPAFMSRLTPEERARFDQALAKARAVLAHAPQLLEETRRKLAAAASEREIGESEREAIAAERGLTRASLDDALAALESLQSLIGSLPELQAALEQSGEAALKLEESLAAAPQGQALDTIRAAWIRELEQFQRLAQELHQQSRSQKSAESARQDRYLARLIDQTRHHLEALQQLDQRQSERITRLLLESAQTIKSLAKS